MKIWILLLLVGVAVAAPSQALREKRNVKTLIDELLKEAGVTDLLPWIQEMINSDPDSYRLKEFFDREQFSNIKTHLKNCPGFDELNAKMQLEGVDLEDILDKVKSFITGGMSRKFQARRPLGEHINEFIEKLDLENIMEIIQNKGKSDPDMKKIIEFMDSKEAKEIEACLLKSQDVQDLLEELYNEGIDAKKLVAMFRALFGLSTYYNQLHFENVDKLHVAELHNVAKDLHAA
uniref:Uncharacterized protein n=1 Tax=Strigamia maritima TaxID=126957 RepID=T1IRR0_STRMM